MNLILLGAGLIVLLIPGLAGMAWLRPFDPAREPAEFLADAIALSISLTSLAGLLFNLLGIYPGAAGAAILYGLCLAGAVTGFLYRGSAPFPVRQKLPALFNGLAAGVCIAALLWFRLYQVRNLVLPNWVDSVHHTLIVRVILERGGLPGDLHPYLDAPFSYHYGFHLLAASFASWAQLSPDQAVLLLGQAINALIALSIYRLARGLEIPRSAAALAGLLTGFGFHMPAYYATWGRYTLSTGLVVLFPAMAAALEVRRHPGNRRAGLFFALLTAGVCLSQYLAIVFLVLFLFVLALPGLWQAIKRRSVHLAPLELAGWAWAGGILAFPWLFRALMDNLSQARVQGIRLAVRSSDWNYLISLLGPRSNHILLGFAALGLLLAGLSAPSSLRLFAAWSSLMLLFSQPFFLQLGPFRPDLYAIVLFAPAAILLVYLIDRACAALGRRTHPRLATGAMILVSSLLLLWGIRENRNIINPVTVLATRADLHALRWAQANLPSDARFFINATPWQGNIYRGTDGGYWLMPYAGFYTLVPPVPYMWLDSSSIEQINRLAHLAGQVKGCTPDFWEIVREARLTHVYIHEGKGSLQSAPLDFCPRLTLLYRQQGVSIYAIEQLP
ncbi:MAG TPA: hypothetical protein DEQ80_12400 [Anaerolinea thermolimosa]|uniref:Glycosyltransferase RgtA/B/C/D-like domain-containing protein n=1 Tax=Anaerolinea thermolimosa TaxID=229919 RepID=A0A3D1JJ97_9CHLR|nr:hypothetical protein [Anaerolinea thermolimosa]GAP07384.1 hypothetical protein ATHL_02257 [Anaerolinea thermolimosa]HCE18649.1 hypothetical protein [Anaerolinea thermolimosa]